MASLLIRLQRTSIKFEILKNQFQMTVDVFHISELYNVTVITLCITAAVRRSTAMRYLDIS